jgi:hypothetical protein
MFSLNGVPSSSVEVVFSFLHLLHIARCSSAIPAYRLVVYMMNGVPHLLLLLSNSLIGANMLMSSPSNLLLNFHPVFLTMTLFLCGAVLLLSGFIGSSSFHK